MEDELKKARITGALLSDLVRDQRDDIARLRAENAKMNHQQANIRECYRCLWEGDGSPEETVRLAKIEGIELLRMAVIVADCACHVDELAEELRKALEATK